MFTNFRFGQVRTVVGLCFSLIFVIFSCLGLTAFPDFTNASIIEWWTNNAAGFHDVIPFDGIWLVRTHTITFLFEYLNMFPRI